MGKEKSTELSKKGPRKTTKKSISTKKDSTNDVDVDSLEYFRDKKERKKLNVIDDKIKLLETELHTLFGGETKDKNPDYTTGNDSKNSEAKPVTLSSGVIKSKDDYENSNYGHVKKKDFKPVSASTPTKFLNARNSESQINTVPNSNSNSFNVSLLSQEKVERLLYESFLLKNSELNLLEYSDSESEKTTTKTNKKISQRSKKRSKDKHEKFVQQTVEKFCRIISRAKKRRIIHRSSSESDVEIVNLESSSCSNAAPKNDTACIDLEMKDYDWNEPFDLDNTNFTSELEIIDENETDENQAPKVNNTDIKETEISYCNNENEKTVLKTGWECPVCFERSKGQEIVATQCGHVFCKKCLENHFSKLNKSCPACRTNLKNKPIITLFNF